MPTALARSLRSLALLQEVRLAADYDLRAEFDRARTFRVLDRADHLFRDWQSIRATPAARAFLMFLLGPRGFTR